MTFLRAHIVFISVALLIAFGVSIITAILEAWFDTRKRPREAMYWCSQGHGYIRKKHMLILFPELKKKNGEDFLVCPLCYKASLFKGMDSNGLKL